VLFVTGCRQSQELIGAAPLDWLKLPAYETVVIDGKSRGSTGKSMLSDRELGELRAAELKHLVKLYRPRLVLVDHAPQGKHRELVPALKAGRETGTRWILGVPGVTGAVPQVGSDLAGDLFRHYFHELLWYGDESVLGDMHLKALEDRFGRVPLECGYVSRLAELVAWQGDFFRYRKKLAGTVSVPWLGEHSMDFLEKLARALMAVSPDYGEWRLFVDPGTSISQREKIWRMFQEIKHCRLEPPGNRYAQALLSSKTCVAYGGYNSIADVLYCGIPALILERQMRDNEQHLHLVQLKKNGCGAMRVAVETELTEKSLVSHILANLSREKSVSCPVNLQGGMNTATILAGRVRQKVG
jgi:predicted glycosyltransferase